jgi:hypothetical protein
MGTNSEKFLFIFDQIVVVEWKKVPQHINVWCIIIFATVDLVFGIPIMQITHDSKIDWLELNETGHKLLFRDKKMRLTLLDTRTTESHSILTYCTFVQVRLLITEVQEWWKRGELHARAKGFSRGWYLFQTYCKILFL